MYPFDRPLGAAGYQQFNLDSRRPSPEEPKPMTGNLVLRVVAISAMGVLVSPVCFVCDAHAQPQPRWTYCSAHYTSVKGRPRDVWIHTAPFYSQDIRATMDRFEQQSRLQFQQDSSESGSLFSSACYLFAESRADVEEHIKYWHKDCADRLTTLGVACLERPYPYRE